MAAHTSERRAAPVTTYLAGLVLGGAAPEAREAFLDDLVVKLEVGPLGPGRPRAAPGW